MLLAKPQRASCLTSPRSRQRPIHQRKQSVRERSQARCAFSFGLLSSPIRRTRSACCARRERPRGGAAEQRDELAPFHSITSSARASNGWHYSALRPANLTTLAHLSVSSVMSLAKSADEPVNISLPSSAIRAFTVGSARAALISRLSRSTISAGVPLGTPTPSQPVTA